MKILTYACGITTNNQRAEKNGHHGKTINLEQRPIFYLLRNGKSVKFTICMVFCEDRGVYIIINADV